MPRPSDPRDLPGVTGQGSGVTEGEARVLQGDWLREGREEGREEA